MKPLTIAIFTLSEHSHVGQVLKPAEALSELGHRVEWLTPGPGPNRRLTDAITSSGATLSPPIVLPISPDFMRKLELAESKTDRTEWFILHMTLGLQQIPAHVESYRALLRELRPDGVIVDASILAGCFACWLERIPYICLNLTFEWLVDLADIEMFVDPAIMAMRRTAMREVFDAVGQDFHTPLLSPMSPWCNALYAPSSLGDLRVGDDAPPTYAIGPSLPPSNLFTDLELPEVKEPYIVVSFGTQVSDQGERIRKVVTAAAELEYTVVVNAGGLVLDQDYVNSLPGAPLLYEQIPQRKLLAHAAALVTHGGATSVLEALVAGVPLLISPVDIDQPVQGIVIQRAGVGVVLDLASASVEETCAALKQLIDPRGAPRQRARAIQQTCTPDEGAHRLAQLVIDLVRDDGSE